MTNTPEKKKGLITSIIVHVLMLLLFFFVGLTYQDPPPEPGIAIVFGFDKQGQGDFTLPTKAIEAAEEVKPVEEEVEASKESVKEPKEISNDEKLITSDEESPVAAKEEVVKPKISEEDIKKKAEEDRIKKEQEEQERIKKEQAQKLKDLQDRLSKLTDSNSDEGKENQGDDDKPGFKGDVKGDPNAKSFVGGSGGDGNYQLGNRKPVSKPKPIYDSKETGIVYVRIIVNKSGKVIFAEAGVKGSTTTDLQLLKRAKEAAMKTTWDSDPSAPERQEGKIIYNFVIEN